MEDVEYVHGPLDMGGFSVELNADDPIKLSMWARYRQINPSEVTVLADIESIDGSTSRGENTTLDKLCEGLKPYEKVFWMSVTDMPASVVGMRVSGSMGFRSSAPLHNLEYLEYTTNGEDPFDYSLVASLKRLDIHADEYAILTDAFAHVYSLEEVNIFGQARLHFSAFSSCTGLRSVKFHDRVLSLESGCFSSCSKLKYCNLEVLDAAQDLSAYAFSGTPVESDYYSRYRNYLRRLGVR